jgi:hypothetical protein
LKQTLTSVETRSSLKKNERRSTQVVSLCHLPLPAHDANVNEVFVVPFDDCLSLYWKAADVYIKKMKDDI